jgi:hypothetical protein
MENANHEHKIQVSEKGFPVNIPEDIESKPLEVINGAGDIVALFYDISFIKTKPKGLVEFINNYDLCFDDDLRWLDPDSDLESEYVEWMEEHVNFDDFAFFHQISIEKRAFSAICRLTYPFHLSSITENECYMCFNWWGNSCDEEEIMGLAFSYGDVKILAKMFETLIDPNIDPGFQTYKDFEKYLRILINKNNVKDMYEHPELFFTNTTIDKYIEIANKVGPTELQTFLRNYKDNYFPTQINAN